MILGGWIFKQQRAAELKVLTGRSNPSTLLLKECPAGAPGSTCSTLQLQHHVVRQGRLCLWEVLFCFKMGAWWKHKKCQQSQRLFILSSHNLPANLGTWFAQQVGCHSYWQALLFPGSSAPWGNSPHSSSLASFLFVLLLPCAYSSCLISSSKIWSAFNARPTLSSKCVLCPDIFRQRALSLFSWM